MNKKITEGLRTPIVWTLTFSMAICLLACNSMAQSRPAKEPVPIEKLQIPEHMATLPAEEFHHYVAKRWETMKKGLADLDKDAVEAVFLGDSITDKWNSNPQTWKKYYGKYSPQNFAIGADTTHGVLRRIKEGNFEGLSPKVVVLLIGVNNVAWGPKHSVRQTADGILKVIQTLHEKLPKTKFLVLGILPRGTRSRDLSFRWEKMYQVNSIVERYADNDRIFYIDIGESFLQENGVPIEGAYGDGVHLSKKGLDIWAAAMDRSFTELIEGKLNNLKPVDFKVQLSSTTTGAKGTVKVTVTVAEKPILSGSILEVIFPAGFYLDRSKTALSEAGQEFASMKTLSPIATITLKKRIAANTDATFELTEITNPTFITTTAKFTCILRNKNGTIAGRGTAEGVSIK